MEPNAVMINMACDSVVKNHNNNTNFYLAKYVSKCHEIMDFIGPITEKQFVLAINLEPNHTIINMMAFIGPKTEKQFVLSINQEHNDVHINMKNGYEAEER
ncbi:unnamed protein product [Adineta steineri]|uniref:Uncharacterized protein n=1 Tax=Adineta steineri TaxID=433720 RepID=A0A815HMP8_9BILA|nr:unnamed protein product [Adineta steineri]CAF3703228.1 unnamed protein product [Adineta steineri]